MIISILFICLASICNAFMDKWMIKYHLLSEEDEAKLNPSWWSFNPLAKYKDGIYSNGKADNFLLKKIGIKTPWLSTNCNDAWHFFKSLMIVLMCAAVVSVTVVTSGFTTKIIELIVLGVTWNLPFNLIFNNKKLK